MVYYCYGVLLISKKKTQVGALLEKKNSRRHPRKATKKNCRWAGGVGTIIGGEVHHARAYGRVGLEPYGGSAFRAGDGRVARLLLVLAWAYGAAFRGGRAARLTSDGWTHARARATARDERPFPPRRRRVRVTCACMLPVPAPALPPRLPLLPQHIALGTSGSGHRKQTCSATHSHRNLALHSCIAIA